MECHMNLWQKANTVQISVKCDEYGNMFKVLFKVESIRKVSYSPSRFSAAGDLR